MTLILREAFQTHRLLSFSWKKNFFQILIYIEYIVNKSNSVMKEHLKSQIYYFIFIRV